MPSPKPTERTQADGARKATVDQILAAVNLIRDHERDLREALREYTAHGDRVNGVAYRDGRVRFRVPGREELITADEVRDDMGIPDRVVEKLPDGGRWVLGATADVESEDPIEDRLPAESFLKRRRVLWQALRKDFEQLSDVFPVEMAAAFRIAEPPRLQNLGLVSDPDDPAFCIRCFSRERYERLRSAYADAWERHKRDLSELVDRKVELLEELKHRMGALPELMTPPTEHWSNPMSVSELATRFGVSRYAMGRWLKSGTVVAEKLSRQRYRVRLADLPDPPQSAQPDSGGQP